MWFAIVLMTKIMIIISAMNFCYVYGHNLSIPNKFGIRPNIKNTCLGEVYKYLRGGSILEDDEKQANILINNVDFDQTPYFSNVLEVSIRGSMGSKNFLEDNIIIIHSKKACELDISTGDYLKIFGRRRKSSYAVVKIFEKEQYSQSSCQISYNLAINLSTRNGDKIKLINIDEHKHFPKIVRSVSFSPIQDSIQALLISERRKEIPRDYELIERFLIPYLNLEEQNNHTIVNMMQILAIKDENDKTLEFLVSNMDTEEVKDENTDRKKDAISSYGLIDSSSKVIVEGPTNRVPIFPGYDSVGGCDIYIKALRELVELPLRFPILWTTAGVPPPKGVLLHGPSGCGKTLICNALVEETGVHVVNINSPQIMSKKGGESERNLREAFQEALKKSPSIIMMDELDSIAPKRDQAQGETEKRIVSQLLTLMDSLNPSSNVIVIGATSRPNSVESALRRPGRFDRELEIPIPDEDGRYEILKIKTNKMKIDSSVDMFQIARDTHGYVGADLSKLTMEAALHCLRDNLDTIDIYGSDDPISNDIIDKIVVKNDNFLYALQVCEPSTLRENKIEIPDVQWSDIGGLENTKRELHQMVRYPIEHRGLFEKIGLHASRGVLFYGPPGCGKTLMAKAIANECGANFISVKGPELLNMWFGGSEANVRDIFSKARAASPCILFFDEIDSIARARGRGVNSNSETSDRVINQILSEIDGISGTKNLFIIGATNRPDILDPGIMRPGRLDQLIYIPLPDKPSRISIFKSNLRKSPVNDDVNLNEIAEVTDGYSGADIAEICQRAAKNAIKESITAKLMRQDAVKSGEISQEDADALPDPVPFITRAHFEASMTKARRSVTQEMLEQYDEFMMKMKLRWKASNNNETPYDIEKAKVEQDMEDMVINISSE